MKNQFRFSSNEHKDVLIFLFAGIVILACAVGLVWLPGRDGLSATPLGKIEAKNAVKRFGAKAARWTWASPGESFYSKDFIATTRETEATLVFSDDRRVELGPRSMIQIDGSDSYKPEVVVLEGRAKGFGIHVKAEDKLSLIPRPIDEVPQLANPGWSNLPPMRK